MTPDEALRLAHEARRAAAAQRRAALPPPDGYRSIDDFLAAVADATAHAAGARAELARACEVNTSTVSKWLRQVKIPSAENLARMAAWFGEWRRREPATLRPPTGYASAADFLAAIAAGIEEHRAGGGSAGSARADLLRVLGVADPTLRSWLRGETRPSQANLDLIAQWWTGGIDARPSQLPRQHRSVKLPTLLYERLARAARARNVDIDTYLVQVLDRHLTQIKEF